MFSPPKFTTFVDEKLKKKREKLKFSHNLENIAGKGENAGYQHFLLYPQCFPKDSYFVKTRARMIKDS